MPNPPHRLPSRRGLLGNAALMTLLAPVLRARDARALPASPRRVIFVFSPNGPMCASGPASGGETDFTLHDWWQPLERHRQHGVFMSHMAATGAGVVTGGGHGLGGQVFSGFGAGARGNQYANKGETIDQVIGKRLEAEQRAGLVRSVVWGTAAASTAGGTGDAFCAAPGRNIVPLTSPQRAWAQLFARFMGPAPTAADEARAAALVVRDRSVLDFVNRNCRTLASTLGREGARLLDDHCTTLRSLERNLVAGLERSPAARTCAKPADPGAEEWANPEHIEPQMASFVDLIAATLACELSHVVAFQFGGQAARNRLPEDYGVPSSPKQDSGDSGPAHHPWTHHGESEEKTTAMRIFTRFYASQVAALVDKLASTSDAGGRPLLESTQIVWASELGGDEKNHDAHQTGSLPVVLFGGSQGGLRTGRYLRGKSADGHQGWIEAGRDMARVLVSAVRYMGLADIKTVGVTGVDGPLAALGATT
jgi:hypothetical protein